jgi:hypothetical protein
VRRCAILNGEPSPTGAQCMSASEKDAGHDQVLLFACKVQGWATQAQDPHATAVQVLVGGTPTKRKSPIWNATAMSAGNNPA